MKKYGYRLIISVLVYYFFRINQEQHWQGVFTWNLEFVLYLCYTVVVVMFLWEVVARSVTYCTDRDFILTNKGLYIISLKATLIVLPFVFLFSYIFVYYIKVNCNCPIDADQLSSLWMMSAQGFVIALLIISYEIIRLYIRNAVQSARETNLIQKELIAARFEGLKNQVNPHFLFNSFSVLTRLVETDSAKAVKFIAKLSDMYRYILENDENHVVTIKQELAFLEDYIFLLEMRHQEGLIIQKNLSLKNWEAKVPPMSLQILVENAVKHNAFSAEEPLRIVITNEGERFIVVANPKRPKSELVNSTGIGLKNLSKRLTLSLKRGLEIVDDTGEFRVKLPISLDL
ncbi:MAG: hypothetical protein GY816_20610 [Cytophagales bacterium]|nr:hypothetical protein [Cytophagales bacterium]